MITAWHAEIRRLTQRRARRNGKPYPLGLRVTGTIEFLRNIGLDVQAMARQGLIDFVIPTTTWQQSWDLACDEIKAALGDDVAVYGSMEAGVNWLPIWSPRRKQTHFVRYLSASAPLMRGAAAGKLVQGLHGIEAFNFFCADPWEAAGGDYAALRGLEQLESLRGKPKQYAFATGPARWSEPLFEYPQQLPFVLEPQWQRELRLPMCREPVGAKRRLTIQVVTESGAGEPDIGVSFNGSWPNYRPVPTRRLLFPLGSFTEHVPDNQAFDYEFPLASIREGWNRIALVNGSRKRDTAQERRDHAVTIASVELAVR